MFKKLVFMVMMFFLITEIAFSQEVKKSLLIFSSRKEQLIKPLCDLYEKKKV
jgi:hypothetical protein